MDAQVPLPLASSPGQALVCSARIAAFSVTPMTFMVVTFMVTQPRNPPVKGAEIVLDELQGGKSDMWRWACCYDGLAKKKHWIYDIYL